MSVRSLRRGSIAASRVQAPATVTAVTFNGSVSNYGSTPDSVANSVTGDIDLRVKAALTDWTPAGGAQALIDKSGSSNRSYGLYVNANGTLRLFAGRTSSDVNFVDGGTATGFTDGATGWVRGTRRASDGEVKFYTSADGSSWTQLGSTTGNFSGNINNATQELRVGISGFNDGPMIGTLFYAEIRDGIDGSVVAKFDPSAVAILGTRNPTSFVAPGTGETWTMSGSAWNWTTV